MNNLDFELSHQLPNEILNALHNKLMIGRIFCNLEWAFDCVSHDILLSKLKLYGVTGKTFSLIKSYLEDRQQIVILNDKYVNNNTYSDWGKIKHGCSSRSCTWTIAFLNLH